MAELEDYAGENNRHKLYREDLIDAANRDPETKGSLDWLKNSFAGDMIDIMWAWERVPDKLIPTKIKQELNAALAATKKYVDLIESLTSTTEAISKRTQLETELGTAQKNYATFRTCDGIPAIHLNYSTANFNRTRWRRDDIIKQAHDDSNLDDKCQWLKSDETDELFQVMELWKLLHEEVVREDIRPLRKDALYKCATYMRMLEMLDSPTDASQHKKELNDLRDAALASYSKLKYWNCVPATQKYESLFSFGEVREVLKQFSDATDFILAQQRKAKEEAGKAAKASAKAKAAVGQIGITYFADSFGDAAGRARRNAQWATAFAGIALLLLIAFLVFLIWLHILDNTELAATQITAAQNTPKEWWRTLAEGVGLLKSNTNLDRGWIEIAHWLTIRLVGFATLLFLVGYFLKERRNFLHVEIANNHRANLCLAYLRIHEEFEIEERAKYIDAVLPHLAPLGKTGFISKEDVPDMPGTEALKMLLDLYRSTGGPPGTSK